MLKNYFLYRLKNNKSGRLKIVFFVTFLFSFSTALISYFQSSFLNQYISEEKLGPYYSLAYIVTFVSLLFFGHLQEKFGRLKSLMLLLVVELFSFFLMAYYTQSYVVIIGFLIYEIGLNLAYLGLDHLVKQDTFNCDTGKTRGVFLTISILAWIISPLLAGYLVTLYSYAILYKISILLVLLILITLSLFYRNQNHIKKEDYAIDFKAIYHNSDIFKIYVVSVISQVFLSAFIIYLPLYLNKSIGLSWEQMGLIFTIMLLAYLLLEYPAGKIADKYLGEKEMLSAGIIIAAISCFAVFYVNASSVLVWIVILFVSRVGAGLIEIMSDTYFFKKVNSAAVGTINFYRTASPVGYIIGPLIFSWLLYFYPMKTIFLILGLITLLALYWALTIKDTK